MRVGASNQSRICMRASDTNYASSAISEGNEIRFNIQMRIRAKEVAAMKGVY